MLDLVSLLPLAAGLMATLLAAMASAVLPRMSRRDLMFVGFNASIALWCFSYGVELWLGLPPTGGLGENGAGPFALYAGQVIGLSATPVFWFFYTARRAGALRWLQGWRMALVHTPLVYTAVVALTNPWHRLVVDQPVPGGPTAYGPLALPHHIGTFALVIPGTWMLLRSAWRERAAEGSRRFVLLAVATLLPLAGGILWSARYALGLPIPLNPVPPLFALLGGVLLYEVVARGFDGIFPLAAVEAFRSMSDVAIVTDAWGRVVETNAAAQRLVPDATPGRSLDDVSEPLARHVRACLASRDPRIAFEIEHRGSVFYGRAQRIMKRPGEAAGCSVLLTDMTDLRTAHRALVRAVGEEQAMRAVGRGS